MNTTKEKKAKLQITITSLVLTVMLIADLYLMMGNGIKYIIPIIILGLIAAVSVYLMVNAIMNLSAEREAQRQAHFDNLYKSEKASYIMLKNKFEEIEGKLAMIQETSRIPSEEIINAQKGIAKVIISRSKENADAIISSNDQVLERLDEIDETQATKFTGISKDQRLKLTEMSAQTDTRLQDMVLQLKDMELRLNQAIMQGGTSKVVMSAVPQYSMEQTPEPIIEEPALFEEKPVLEEVSVFEEEPVLEEVPVFEEEPIFEEEVAIPQEEPVIDLSDPNKAMSPDEIAALFASANAVAEEPVAEEPVVEEPVVEELPPMPDVSDPNKALNADEIAALFANMSPAEEEPVVEEPVVEELPPMPDLSDPNRALSPDEIAALIANL